MTAFGQGPSRSLAPPPDASAPVRHPDAHPRAGRTAVAGRTICSTALVDPDQTRVAPAFEVNP
jgi:hypothetical protein